MAGSPAPTRRPAANRPDMVPLTEFGKAAPPPPKAATNWRNVSIAVAVILLIVLASGWAIASAQSSFQSYWGSTKCLDTRKGC